MCKKQRKKAKEEFERQIKEKINFHMLTLALWVECSPMVRKTEVQSPVELYQILKKKMVLDAALLIIQHYKVRKCEDQG